MHSDSGGACFTTSSSIVGDTHNKNARPSKEVWKTNSRYLENLFRQTQLTRSALGKPTAASLSWSHDLTKDAQKCGERCCEPANKSVEQLHEESTTCLDDRQLKDSETVRIISFLQKTTVSREQQPSGTGHVTSDWPPMNISSDVVQKPKYLNTKRVSLKNLPS